MDREAFLTRIRSALDTSLLPPHPTEDPGAYVPPAPSGSLVDRFCTELEAVDGVAHRATGIDDARRIVMGLMEGHRTFMARGNLPIPGLAGHLIHEGFHIVGTDVPSDPVGRLDHQRSYMDLEVGITSVDAALAESGSIVLTSGRESPRMASLIPQIHIALVATDQIYPSLSHLLAERPDLVTAGSNLVVITGPSRTGDIEQTLTLGVHGPRHVHVVLVPGA